MTDNIQSNLDKVRAIYEAVDKAISEYKGSDNLQIPSLLRMMAASEGWSDNTVRENDPIVRFYIRNHSDWAINKGPHGGIVPRSIWAKKQEVKSAKAIAKQQMQAEIDAKLASNAADTSGRKAFLDTMVEMGKKLLNEQNDTADVVQPIELEIEGNTFTSTDDEFEESSRIVRENNAVVSVPQQDAPDAQLVEQNAADVFADLDEDEDEQKEYDDLEYGGLEYDELENEL